MKTKFIRKKLDQTITLVTQAMSALTFHRRRAVLTSLVRNKERAHRWVKEKYHSQLLASKSELFGKSFFKAVQRDAKSVDLSVIQYLQNQSKRSKPPFRGGSATKPRLQTSSSFAEPQRAATTSSRGARGKTPAQYEQSTHFQHRVETSESNKCTSNHKRDASPLQPKSPHGGKTETFSPTMERNNKRSGNPRVDKRLQNPTLGSTISSLNPQSAAFQQRTKPDCDKRGGKHAGNGCDSKSESRKWRNHKQCLHKGEKGKRAIQTNNQLEPLNVFIPHETFKMETLKNVKDLLQKGDLLIKIDLKMLIMQ